MNFQIPKFLLEYLSFSSLALDKTPLHFHFIYLTYICQIPTCTCLSPEMIFPPPLRTENQLGNKL